MGGARPVGADRGRQLEDGDLGGRAVRVVSANATAWAQRIASICSCG
jgi:hypothetical protein